MIITNTKKIIGTVLSLALIGNLFGSPVNGQNAENATSPVKHRPRIALALGGGGSRGSGHVGVLKVFEEEHIPIDIVTGTSIGSVVGGFYAAGVPLNDLSDLFEKDEFIHEFMPMPLYVRLPLEPVDLIARLFGYKPFDGLYNGGLFKKYADKLTGSKQIEKLRIPYAAVVTNVVTGESERLTQGDLGLAMQASTAVPGLKRPVQIGDHLYCDGGVVCNVPVKHAREMGADFVIAVNIDEFLKDQPLENFRVLGSMSRQALRIELASEDGPFCEKADVAVHPDMTGIGLISRKKSNGLRGIDAGIKAAREAMPEIKRKLSALGVMTASGNTTPN
jgi:NTE family protein